jgi:hypothetical protein
VTADAASGVDRGDVAAVSPAEMSTGAVSAAVSSSTDQTPAEMSLVTVYCSQSHKLWKDKDSPDHCCVLGVSAEISGDTCRLITAVDSPALQCEIKDIIIICHPRLVAVDLQYLLLQSCSLVCRHLLTDPETPRIFATRP